MTSPAKVAKPTCLAEVPLGAYATLQDGRVVRSTAKCGTDIFGRLIHDGKEGPLQWWVGSIPVVEVRR